MNNNGYNNIVPRGIGPGRDSHPAQYVRVYGRWVCASIFPTFTCELTITPHTCDAELDVQKMITDTFRMHTCVHACGCVSALVKMCFVRGFSR